MPNATAHDHYKRAIELKNRIIAGQSNETPVQAWAGVCRACAKASNAKWNELGDRVHGPSQHSFFNNLDRVWWAAKAQVETLARQVA